MQTAKEIMTTPVVTIAASASVAEAMQLMSAREILTGSSPIPISSTKWRLRSRNRKPHHHPRIPDAQANSDDMMLKISNIFG
jgi:CBS domain-containing protein